jgi:segregation and condensation protein B
MSRLPDHNSHGLPIDKAVENGGDQHADPSQKAESELQMTGADEDVFEQVDDDDDEFSLSQLSQAYAKLKRTEADPNVDASRSEEQRRNGQADSSSIGTATIGEMEARDNAGCPVTPASIVEAIVFVGLPGDEKLTLKKISSLLRDVSPKEIKSIVKQLNDRYEMEQAAYRIVHHGESVSMDLHQSMLPFQQELSRQNKGVKLNAATIEVLAVVAYNQPITRDKIDETRRKSSGAILSQLIKRGLVTPIQGERSPQKQLLITTDKFLNLFQLADLTELPHASDLSDLDELLS